MYCSSVVGFSHNPANVIFRQSIAYTSKICASKNGSLRAKVNDEYDPLLQAAISAASLRLQETLQPEPLFHDPYAGCFFPRQFRLDDKKQCSLHYLLATKFIDDKLVGFSNQTDGLKQVVLLTDGMDTRPYRLSWPASTRIFDISPDRIFREATEKLQRNGAKLPKGCLFRHIPLESSNIQQTLCADGFNGNRPSIWAIQGLPVMNLSSFEEMLITVSGLATKGCFFLGVLPARVVETNIGTESSVRQWMEKLFLSNGFRVEMVNHEEVARSFGKLLAPGNYKSVLFVAEQLRFSDDQMETWRSEFQRLEEEGDEEGFEEL
ncbi:O-methyltransferase 1, chloroplastic [Humulus lupulus]|uniref:O-methyltransferase 1, chloroplastic n=1 Tax=Humulus lupulus TaxID=3486 RepID=UPI002B40CD5C|nr:O-methyltransferase 1, chloroplastic [Humulus lupulus]